MREGWQFTFSGAGRAFLLLFVTALTVRMVLVVATGYYREAVGMKERGEFMRIADNLARTGEFANPYVCNTGLTAHTPPAFPFLLSLIFRFTNPDYTRELVLTIVSSMATAALYGLMPWFAAAIGWAARVGWLAGMVGAVFPLYFWYEVRGTFDAPWVALCALLITGLMARAAAKAEWRRVILAALGTGIALNFAATLLPACLGLGAFVMLAWRRQGRPVMLPSIAALLLVAALVGPWITRCYLVFGELFFMRNNFGLELQTYNNPYAQPTVDRTAAVGGYREHPCDVPGECAKVAQMGEAAYFEMKKAQAIAWIQANPAHFLRLTAQRTLFFWFAPLRSAGKRVVAALITLLGLAGVLLCLRRRQAAGVYLGIPLLLYPLAYYLLHADPRYAYPMYPFMLIAATGFVIEAMKAREKRGEARVGRTCKPGVGAITG